MSYPNTRDCEHGRQRGHCPDCERDDALDEIATLRAVIDDDELLKDVAERWTETHSLQDVAAGNVFSIIHHYRAAVRERIKVGG